MNIRSNANFLMSAGKKLPEKLIRFGFTMLYHQFAWSYDAVSWLVSLGAWRQWQMASLPYLRGPRVLELAHGPGHMLLALRKQGYQVTGIDLSPQMGTLSYERLTRACEQAGIIRCPAQFLPFSRNSFDSVLSTFPTEFILDPLTLAAVHRVLDENGRFIVVPESKLTGTLLIEKIIEWLYAITGQRGFFSSDQEFSDESQGNRWQILTDIFQQYGFLLKHQIITLSRSQVTVLIAEKG